MLAQETTLREIAGRLTAAGEWDTESIYESLTEAFGNNLSLDKQSKDDTKEVERNINIKQDQLDLLWQLEEFRKKHEHQAEPSDWAIRMCEAFVARSMGFTDRYSGRNCSGRRVKLSSPSTGSPAASATM